MEIYEARDILESNGYLVERTPLEARTNDRFEIPKISKLDDVKKERENALLHLFSDTTATEFDKAFRLLFRKEFVHEGIYIINAISRSNINEISIQVYYRKFINNYDYLADKNHEIFKKMVGKINGLSTIETYPNINVKFYGDHFNIELYIDHLKAIDTKIMMSELKKIKENVGAAMYDGIQKVTKIVKGFNSSYERAWDK